MKFGGDGLSFWDLLRGILIGGLIDSFIDPIYLFYFIFSGFSMWLGRGFLMYRYISTTYLLDSDQMYKAWKTSKNVHFRDKLSSTMSYLHLDGFTLKNIGHLGSLSLTGWHTEQTSAQPLHCFGLKFIWLTKCLVYASW